jgi:hypothetical protein
MLKHSYKIKFFYTVLLLSLLSCSTTSNDPFKDYQSDTPLLLAHGSLSTDSVQWGNCFVSATGALYQTRPNATGATLYRGTMSGQEFVEFEPLDFSIASNCTDVFVTHNGNELFFASNRTDVDSIYAESFEIWKSTRTDNTWQTPEKVDIPLKGSKFYPTLTTNGTLFFSFFETGSPSADLFYMDLAGNHIPVKLPEGINTDQMEGDPFIAPDGSFMIFAAFERAECLGKSDLYIAYFENGQWGNAIWLGADINSDGYDGSPFVTEDGKHLIFTSSRGSRDQSIFFNHYIVDFDWQHWKQAN